MPATGREHGQGALPSLPDPRDYRISDLLASVGFEAAAWAPPASYTIPDPPPILDQGISPMCVAYSHAAMKAWQDHRDVGIFYNFDEAAFFALIGGNDSGAIARNALERMRQYGYPIHAGQAEKHRIKAYYAVDQDVLTIKAAIATFGALTMIGPWFHNWIFGLPSSAILPQPDYGGNGHAVLVIGWDDAKGSFYCQNSWGTAWAAGGRFWMPWYYAVNTMWELWKAVDELTGPTGSWRGRARTTATAVTPNAICNVRDHPSKAASTIWAQTRPDGFTHRIVSGKIGPVLWTNGSQYLFDGKYIGDFAEVKTSAGKVLYINRRVLDVTIQP